MIPKTFTQEIRLDDGRTITLESKFLISDSLEVFNSTSMERSLLRCRGLDEPYRACWYRWKYKKQREGFRAHFYDPMGIERLTFNPMKL